MPFLRPCPPTEAQWQGISRSPSFVRGVTQDFSLSSVLDSRRHQLLAGNRKRLHFQQSSAANMPELSVNDSVKRDTKLDDKVTVEDGEFDCGFFAVGVRSYARLGLPCIHGARPFPLGSDTDSGSDDTVPDLEDDIGKSTGQSQVILFSCYSPIALGLSLPRDRSVRLKIHTCLPSSESCNCRGISRHPERSGKSLKAG